MCGIIGFTGNTNAKNIILNGLKSLEYRGYDSAGISFFDENAKTHTIKTVGKVDNLVKLVEGNTAKSSCGIGHTRWATHGGVVTENCHPHSSGHIHLVHNGIIENYQELIKEYNIKSTDRKSETDTEIAAILLSKFYEEFKNDPLKALQKLDSVIKGTYSFCILFDDKPNEIYAIRKSSPLVCANTTTGSFLSSDLTALIPYTKNYFIVPEMDIIKLTPYEIKCYDIKNLKEQKLEAQDLNWSPDSALKGGYAHYMLKEIHEQPDALINTISQYIKDDLPDFSGIGLTDDILKQITNVQILACGTARHAGLVASNTFAPILKMPVTTFVASEYRYSEPMVDKNSLIIAVSQSGETADTLAALELASEYTDNTVALVNRKASLIARVAKYQLYTEAGPEISVASTKAYTVQVAALYLLFAKMAYLRNKMTIDELKNFTDNLISQKEIIQETLKNDKVIKEVAKFLKFKNDCFYIGRLQDYISSLEGALKLKEISYIHTDAYAAGELKHGTIALINDGVPVICIDTNERISSKLLSNVQEVKARNASVILIINETFEYNKAICDYVIPIKNDNPMFAVFPVSVITQLIAYYTSVERGLDVDRPRNLAKSVTVE